MDLGMPSKLETQFPSLLQLKRSQPSKTSADWGDIFSKDGGGPSLLGTPTKPPHTYLSPKQLQSGRLPPARATFGATAEDKPPSRLCCAQQWGRPTESSAWGFWGDGYGAWSGQQGGWWDTRRRRRQVLQPPGLFSMIFVLRLPDPPPLVQNCVQGLPWRFGARARAWGEEAGRRSAPLLPDRNQETQIRFSHRLSGRRTCRKPDMLPS